MPTRARLASQPPLGNPASHGTGPEHGGKQGIAQPATRSQPSQRRRLLCKQLFTTGFVARVSPPAARYSALTQPHAASVCGASAAPCPDVPREAGGLGPREGSLGETRSQHRLPQRRAAGRREMARGCGQPPRSPDSPGKGFFFPKSPQPGGPALRPERAGLLSGAMQGTAPGAGARGRFPQPLVWCGGAALATFPWAVATPSILGRKGAACRLFTSRSGNIRR